MSFRFIIFALFMGFSLAFGQWTPPNTPTYEFTWHSDDETCDYMFLGLIGSVSPSSSSQVNLILDRHGDIVWYQRTAFQVLDFKIHPTGQMSFFYQGDWFVMDSTFSVTDTLNCQGYETDVHDLLLTEDGHAYLICIEDTTMDLSGIYTRNGVPGDPSGSVRAHLVQELDAQKNVVKEWHAIDHFDLSDHDTIFFIDPSLMRLNHTNSIFLHEGDKMLISHRYNHELTYIDWSSGEIIWRLGGANNEFNFVNDIGINAQHFGQILPDGQVSVFDNGTYHNPPLARGLVYDLDTTAMTATKVREFANPNLFSSAYGSYQVMPNGDALVNFGAYNPHVDPNVVYVKADSSVVLEMKFEDLYWTYRAQCLPIPFALDRPEIVCTEQNGVLTLTTAQSHPSYLWTTDATTASITLTDTGKYQVFVPRGLGMMGSEVFRVSDLTGGCTAVNAAEASSSPARPGKLLEVYDLSGRPVTHRKPQTLYFEVYSNGLVKKVWSGK